MITEHRIRLLRASQAPEYEERATKLSPWRSGFIWFGGLIACLGILYLAGQCLSMAWESLPL